jgi:hypothetical protein
MMIEVQKKLEGHKNNKQRGKVGTTTPPLLEAIKRWPYARWIFPMNRDIR